MLITPGLLTCIAFVILILKMRTDTVRKLLGFDIPLDIAVFLTMTVMFAGTFAGMIAAMVGGLCFSLSLIALKKIYGYKKLTIERSPDHLLPAIRWVAVPGLLK